VALEIVVEVVVEESGLKIEEDRALEIVIPDPEAEEKEENKNRYTKKLLQKCGSF